MASEFLKVTKNVKTSPTYNNSSLPSLDHLELLKKSVSFAHVKSYDYFLSQGISRGVSDLNPAELDLFDKENEDEEEDEKNDRYSSRIKNDGTKKTMVLWIENVKLQNPINSPRICREMGLSYGGGFSCDLCYRIDDKKGNRLLHEGQTRFVKLDLGELPLMVASLNCMLRDKTPKELVEMKEESLEFGGYFIVNGIEKCIRMLQVPRRNHMMGIQRDSFKNRGNLYTNVGVFMRCGNANHDMSTITNTLHYLTNGSVLLKFMMYRQEFFIPIVLILRALGNGLTDEEIYNRVSCDVKSSKRGGGGNKALQSRVLVMFESLSHQYPNLTSEKDCLVLLGSLFRNKLLSSDTVSDEEVGKQLLKRYVMIHLEKNHEKQECLIQMFRKLISQIDGLCAFDNQDSFQNHEILLPGHLFSMYLKEKFQFMLNKLREGLTKEFRMNSYKSLNELRGLKFEKLVKRYSMTELAMKQFWKLLSTGYLESRTGLDLMQNSGFAIVAERLNFWRFISHFRAIHRGSYFAEMKTTSVRKLLPDSWGFLCCVHTPDGTPCGLLNHITIGCDVISGIPNNYNTSLETIEKSLFDLGVSSKSFKGDNVMTVWLDGKVVGWTNEPKRIASSLRLFKVQEKINRTLEVAYIPFVSNTNFPYPGLFLFTAPGESNLLNKF